jgi:putative ABC transport system substrate-binding protein
VSSIQPREFIRLVAGGMTAWPLAAHPQQAKGPVRIGFLPFGSRSKAYDRALVEVFQEGLHKAGLVENRDIVLDVMWISGDPDQAMTELMQRGAQTLIFCGSSASVAAQRLAPTIPIVFISVGNPIAMGLVDSLSHNATGFSDIQCDLTGKLVDVARELGRGESVGCLWYIIPILRKSDSPVLESPSK